MLGDIAIEWHDSYRSLLDVHDHLIICINIDCNYGSYSRIRLYYNRKDKHDFWKFNTYSEYGPKYNIFEQYVNRYVDIIHKLPSTVGFIIPADCDIENLDILLGVFL